ncbi:MAG: Rieske 2Fe-2S domain-containing protein [Thiobacillus sp.]|uniref:Rieske (2Fe-2S) protein n=1 Tax=Thiobacillus sp. TaxID=924 RepID=UPI00273650AB|nr:Rieske 2Fe-2S domain-containing protein [Thiobacillus sp.]MDP3420104.1 Rieske 2Fe-2S domain-containing protein [Thiobacillus sp.]MDP3583750.1 Rieske 2Fe-2S domain-containing protein [Thiobacillus sp.]
MACRERLICAAADLAELGRGVRFEVVRAGQPQPAFVVRFGGQPRAFLNQCGHVPVELDWQEGEFFDDSRLYLICSTHGALYHPASGHCVGGRCAGRGLISLSVVERDGHVYLMEEQ